MTIAHICYKSRYRPLDTGIGLIPNVVEIRISNEYDYRESKGTVQAQL